MTPSSSGPTRPRFSKSWRWSWLALLATSTGGRSSSICVCSPTAVDSRSSSSGDIEETAGLLVVARMDVDAGDSRGDVHGVIGRVVLEGQPQVEAVLPEVLHDALLERGDLRVVA